MESSVPEYYSKVEFLISNGFYFDGPLKTVMMGIILAVGLTAIGHGERAVMDINGESLVLAGTLSGNLFFDRVVKGIMVLRDPYFPGITVYKQGRDYTVDYKEGTVSRPHGVAHPRLFPTRALRQKRFRSL